MMNRCFNPELRRNVWIELTTHKLIVTPLTIMAIAYWDYLMSMNLTFMVALFFLFISGTKAAAASIPTELNARTWDIQRLSGLSPWTLTWGKLFGSTVYSWYGAIIALIIYYTFGHPDAIGSVPVFLEPLEQSALILSALLTHSLAMLLSMVALQGRPHKASSFIYYIITLFIAVLVIYPVYHIITGTSFVTTWYGWEVSNLTIGFSFLSFYLFWSMLGIYRNMQDALSLMCRPWAWFSFTVFCMIYQTGFVYNVLDRFLSIDHFFMVWIRDAHLSPALYVAFFIAAWLTTIAISSQKLSVLNYQKLLHRRLHFLPRWTLSFLCTLFMGLWICTTPRIEGFIPAIFALSTLLLLTRDVLIMHYFQFCMGRKPVLTAAFYFALLYILIPALLKALGGFHLIGLFYPSTHAHQLIYVAGIGVQIVVMAWLVRKRWLSSCVNQTMAQ